jgi:prepilin-type N-terminal cleavage/methylation domain-containing protein
MSAESCESCESIEPVESVESVESIESAGLVAVLTRRTPWTPQAVQALRSLWTRRTQRTLQTSDCVTRREESIGQRVDSSTGSSPIAELPNCPIDVQSATSREPKGSEGGFTLLEVIVSVALLGLILATAFELLGVGLQSAKTAGNYTQATILAKRMLADLSLGTLTAEALEGSSGDYRWMTEIAPEGDGGEALPVRLYNLRVRVSWPGRRGEKGVELVTLRAATTQETVSESNPNGQRPRGGPASPSRRGQNR